MNKQLLVGTVSSSVESRVTSGGVAVAEARLVTEEIVNRAAAQHVHRQTHFLRGYGAIATRMLSELSEGAIAWIEAAFVSEKGPDGRWVWHSKVVDLKRLGQREPEPAKAPRKAPPMPPCLMDDGEAP